MNFSYFIYETHNPIDIQSYTPIVIAQLLKQIYLPFEMNIL